MSKASAKLDAARTIVAAVNARDAALYASVFAENAVVRLYDGPVRISGRSAIEENRRRHFAAHPNMRCELQHLVEIGDVVVMHDRVQLTTDAEASDIVEIYSFDEKELISKVDVVQ